MKPTSLLFALYILVLSVCPCSDSDTCIDEHHTNYSANAEYHEHAEQETDFCTPFCICACCAAQVQLTHSTEIVFKHPIRQSNTRPATLYVEKTLLQNAGSIWQPPKSSNA